MPFFGAALSIVILCAPGPNDHAGGSSEDARVAPPPLPAADSTQFASSVEPDFPFITTTVDAGSRRAPFPDHNVSVRGVVLWLAAGVYACFDPDLLRMSMAWTGEFVTDLIVVAHGASDSITAVAVDGAPPEAQLRLRDDRYVVFALPEGESSRQWRVAAWTGPSRRLESFLRMRRHPSSRAARGRLIEESRGPSTG